jgi:hypothetical protein
MVRMLPSKVISTTFFLVETGQAGAVVRTHRVWRVVAVIVRECESEMFSA